MYTRPPASIVSVPTPDGNSAVYISETETVAPNQAVIPPFSRVYFERFRRLDGTLSFRMRSPDTGATYGTFRDFDSLRAYIDSTELDILVVVNA